MKLEDLKMGDMFRGSHGDHSTTVVVVVEENDGHDRSLMIVRGLDCYYFVDDEGGREAQQEKEYWKAVENGEYTYIGNFCSVIKRANKI